MTIDEAIEMYKKIANADSNCPRYCMNPCEECVKECKQIAEWLEELKAIKSDGFTDDLLNMGFTKVYKKALDDFIHECDKHCGYYKGENRNLTRGDVLMIAEQLKACGENE